jgi:hypothetical protein
MSFVPVANDSDFPIENLPFGIFSSADNVSDRNFKVANLFVIRRSHLTLFLSNCFLLSRLVVHAWPLENIC